MNRKSSIAFLCATTLLLSACSPAPQDSVTPPGTTPPPVVSSQDKPNDTIKVDEGLFDVTITLPSSFVDMYTEGERSEELSDEAKADGMKSLKYNDDGSLTMVMTKKAQKKVLADMHKGLTDSFDESISDGTFTSIKQFKLNDSATSVTIRVEKEAFEDGMDGFALLGVYISCGMYQLFNNVSPDDINVKIDIIDIATKEVYKTINYPQDMND